MANKPGSSRPVLRGPTLSGSKAVIGIATTALLVWLIFTLYMGFCFRFPKGTLASPPFGHTHMQQKAKTEEGVATGSAAH